MLHYVCTLHRQMESASLLRHGSGQDTCQSILHSVSDLFWARDGINIKHGVFINNIFIILLKGTLMHLWLFFSVATSRQHNGTLHDGGGCVCVDKLLVKEAPRALCLQICRGHSQVLHGSVHLAIDGDNSLRLLQWDRYSDV